MAKAHNETEVFDIPDAAKYLKMTSRGIEYLVASRQIPFSRVGKRNVRFLRSRLDEWLRSREGIEYKRITNSK